MLFSSLEFLFLFLPISVSIYFILPRSLKNFWLLLSGLCFYGIGEPEFLPLMLTSIVVNYAFGYFISKAGENFQNSRMLLWISVIYNVGVLICFKFFSPKLPIGISFYTFQALSYVIDVYKKSVSRAKSIVDFGAYIALYPQLVAGPIVRYGDIAERLRAREHSAALAASGLRTFICGLAKKVILANVAGELWSSFSARNSVLDAYFGIFAFAAQIYFDFSGYSDMALGLGRIFGFEFGINFDYPYVSQSISDFWRRWHISLSSFFREYVYIPLGGNRRGKARTYLNLLITWGLTGIWHGAELNFLCWGLYFALILICEKAFLGKLVGSFPRIFRHTYSIALIGIGWLIFAADGESLTFAGLWGYLLRLIGVGADRLMSVEGAYDATRHLIFALIIIIGSTPLPKRLWINISERNAAGKILCKLVLPLCALLISVAYIANSGYNPFLYFRF